MTIFVITNQKDIIETMAGAPKGNNNAGKGRDATRALQLALDQYAEKGHLDDIEAIGRIKTIALMWRPLILRGLEDGDLAALKEIHDRLDGKPHQSIDMIADVTARNAKELSDDELADIASGSG